MRKVTIGCDRCSGPVADGAGGALVMVGGTRPPSWPTALESGRPALDLCAACLAELTSWLRHPVDAEPRAAPAQRATQGDAPSEGETDPDLAAVVDAWPRLPAPIRAAITTLVNSVPRDSLGAPENSENPGNGREAEGRGAR